MRMHRSVSPSTRGTGLLLAWAFAAITLVQAVPQSALAQGCSIQGPSRAGIDDEFTLCGPEVQGALYEWSGQGVMVGQFERCVRVRLFANGTFTFRLLIRRGQDSTSCTHDVTVGDGGKDTCFITGPSNVAEDVPFVLCGPEGPFSYDWDGPNVATSDTGRCISVSGLSRGTYWFTLTVENGGVRTCRHRVTVGRPDQGAACPQPASFWKDHCSSDRGRGRDKGDDDDDKGKGDDEGHGKGKGKDRDDPWRDEFARIAGCVDARTSLFDWADDARGFCRVLRTKDDHALGQLRKQYLVLLANLCAFEHGVAGPNGRLIGIDPATKVSCKGVKAGNLRELVARVEGLIADHHRCSRKELLRAASCLSNLNRGKGLECEEDEDDDARAIATAEAELELSEQSAADFGLPTPNPFREFTRVRYSVTSDAEVQIGVYDLAGRMIQQLAKGRWTAGVHEVSWNGARSDGSRVRPGMYFVRGTIGADRVTARIMYIR